MPREASQDLNACFYLIHREAHSNFQGSANLAKRVGTLPMLGFFYFEGFEVGLDLVSEVVINIV